MNRKIQITTILLYLSVIFIIVINILCAIFGGHIIASKKAMIFITIFSLTCHLIILILLKNKFYLKIALCYYLYGIFLSLIQIIFMDLPTPITGTVFRVLLFIRNKTFVLWASFSMYYIPGKSHINNFYLYNQNIFNVIFFVLFSLLYTLKIKKVATN
jgi:hypothetical protein